MRRGCEPGWRGLGGVCVDQGGELSPGPRDQRRHQPQYQRRGHPRHHVIIMTLSCHCDGAAARTPAGELSEQRLVQRLEAREGLQQLAVCIVSVVTVLLSSPATAEIEGGETRPIIYLRLHFTNIVHRLHVIVLFVKCKVP